jgi:hypothetical protein
MMREKIKKRRIRILEESINKMKKIEKDLEKGKKFNRIEIWKQIGTIYPTEQGFIDDIKRKEKTLKRLTEVI